jgi:membrane-associated phospholipid phosphatase
VEARILLAIHGIATPGLDRLFWLSHHMGTFRFWAIVAVLAIAWNWRRGDRAEAWLWLALSLSTLALIDGLKPLVGRARPDLWPRIIIETGCSFPSGHALAAATLYPLLARSLARARPDRAAAAYAFGFGLALFVSFGRLYLGVHWPTDVLGGWALAAAQTMVALRLRARKGPAPPSPIRAA